MKMTLAAPEFSHFIKGWHLSPELDTGDFIFLLAHNWLSAGLQRGAGRRATNPRHLRISQGQSGSGGYDLRQHRGDDDVSCRPQATHFDVRENEGRIQLRPYPARTAIGVSELITEGTILEIRVIARRS